MKRKQRKQTEHMNELKKRKTAPVDLKIQYLSPLYRHKARRLNVPQGAPLLSKKYIPGYIPMSAGTQLRGKPGNHDQGTFPGTDTAGSGLNNAKRNLKKGKKDLSARDSATEMMRPVSLFKFAQLNGNAVGEKLLTFVIPHIPKLPLTRVHRADEYVYSAILSCVGSENRAVLAKYAYVEAAEGYIVYFSLSPLCPIPQLQRVVLRIFGTLGSSPGVLCYEPSYTFFQEELALSSPVTEIPSNEEYVAEYQNCIKKYTLNTSKEDTTTESKQQQKQAQQNTGYTKIDYTMLQDVPKSELSSVVESILNFRNDVLIKEQEKLKHAKLQELQKHRDKLKTVYQEFLFANDQGQAEEEEEEENSEKNPEEDQDEAEGKEEQETEDDETAHLLHTKTLQKKQEDAYQSLVHTSTTSKDGLLYKYNKLLTTSTPTPTFTPTPTSTLPQEYNYNKREIIEQRRLDEINRTKYGALPSFTRSTLSSTLSSTLPSTTSTSTPSFEKSVSHTPGIKISLSTTTTTTTTTNPDTSDKPTAYKKFISQLIHKQMPDENDTDEIVEIILDTIRDHNYEYDNYTEELGIILTDLFESTTTAPESLPTVVQDILTQLRHFPA